MGGIMANKTHCAEFLLENLEIQNNVIMQSYLHGEKKLFSGIKLHLSVPGVATGQRGVPSYWSAGIDQRGICSGKDRWIQALPLFEPAVRLEHGKSDAMRSLRHQR